MRVVENIRAHRSTVSPVINQRTHKRIQKQPVYS